MRKLSDSQNFIKRQSLVRELLSSTNINVDDLVVEIGPGKGIITKELLTRAREVIAVEEDQTLADRLAFLAHRGNLRVIAKDFLSWPLPQEKYKVFANIPFNLTTDIVDKITSSSRPTDDAYLVMQEAAAHMFAGQPHYKESLKSIKLSVKYDVNVLRSINRTEFSPEPGVNIAFIHLHKRNKALVPPDLLQDFYDFVVYGYSQSQPTVLDAFKKVFSHEQRKRIERDLAFATLRPTDLSLEEWAALFDVYLNRLIQEKDHLLKEVNSD